MAEFKPITINTQEEMDKLFQDRLDREAKKYADYTSPGDLAKIKSDYDKQISELNTQNAASKADFEKKIAEQESKIQKYESDSVKTRVAIEAGLDPKFAARLVGKDEKEWKADAEALAKDFRAAHPQPRFDPEGDPSPKTAAKAALTGMLHSLNGGN